MAAKRGEARNAQKIAMNLAKRIEAKEFGTAGKMPSRQKLRRDYENVSVTTLDDAISYLQMIGKVRPGTSGANSVTDPTVLPIPLLTPSFDQWLRQHDREPYIENIEIKEFSLDTELAQNIGLEPGIPVIQRIQVQGECRRSEKIPYRITENVFLDKYARPHIEKMKNPLFNLAKEIEKATGPIVRSDLRGLTMRLPTVEEQEILGVTYVTPLLDGYRISMTEDGIPVMCTHLILIGYRFRLDIPNIPTHL